jgi:hypothetical protein
MSAETYPGDSAATTSVDDTCYLKVPAVAASIESGLSYAYLFADRQTWDLGAHTVICTLGRTDGKKLDGPVPRR